MVVVVIMAITSIVVMMDIIKMAVMAIINAKMVIKTIILVVNVNRAAIQITDFISRKACSHN
uniref:hypothetical protein n=1 Tax=Priestia megaterium TaxID=1404 RepID=UPI003F49B042